MAETRNTNSSSGTKKIIKRPKIDDFADIIEEDGKYWKKTGEPEISNVDTKPKRVEIYREQHWKNSQKGYVIFGVVWDEQKHFKTYTKRSDRYIPIFGYVHGYGHRYTNTYARNMYGDRGKYYLNWGFEPPSKQDIENAVISDGEDKITPHFKACLKKAKELKKQLEKEKDNGLEQGVDLDKITVNWYYVSDGGGDYVIPTQDFNTVYYVSADGTQEGFITVNNNNPLGINCHIIFEPWSPKFRIPEVDDQYHRIPKYEDTLPDEYHAHAIPLGIDVITADPKDNPALDEPFRLTASDAARIPALDTITEKPPKSDPGWLNYDSGAYISGIYGDETFIFEGNLTSPSEYQCEYTLLEENQEGSCPDITRGESDGYISFT